MLLRETKADLALAQIEQALVLGPRIRSLHHTKGVVLRELALSLESRELGRRRLAQSEAAFRQALRLDDRDDYSYQALGELYLGWAKKVDSSEERADYVAKAQEIVETGLQKVRDREGLWIVSSDIERWLGNTPGALDALRSAVRTSPGGIFGRYLLGKAYRKRGELQEAVDVLRPLVEDHPDQYRAVLEYSRVELLRGESWRRAIAILELAKPAGFEDAAYIAALGGLLFMSRQFSEADAVFRETDRRQFSFRERTRVAFRPRGEGGGEEMELVGDVTLVKAGYAFIDVPGYPSFFCPKSRFGDLVMERGLRIAFQPAFSARGAQVDKPKGASEGPDGVRI